MVRGGKIQVKRIAGKDGDHIVAIFQNLKQQPFDVYRARDIVWNEYQETIGWQTLASFERWGWLEIVDGGVKPIVYRIRDDLADQLTAKLAGKRIIRRNIL